MSVFFLELPVFLLLIGKGKQGFLISFCLYILFCGALLFPKKTVRKPKLKIQYPLLSLWISLLCGAKFYLTWGSSGRLAAIAKPMNMPGNQCCIILALILAASALFGIDHVITLCVSLIKKNEETAGQTFSEVQAHIWIFMTSLVTMTLNSRCSPLYPFNNWVDPNTMFTVGKGVLRGRVPYRDLYEQKGPLLLFFHTIGASVSFDSFIGVWILEVLAAFTFLLFSYKTICLYFGKVPIPVIPLLSVIVYGSLSFSTGDSAEEFGLPFLAYALFLLCKALENDELPSKKEFFLIGVTSACVFWIKYSMTGFYLGWILVLFFYAVKMKKMRSLFSGGCLIALGLAAGTIPIAVYFTANSSLDHLWEAYFFNNVHYYTDSRMNVLSRLLKGLQNLVKYNAIALTVSFIGLFWALDKHKWKTVSVIAVTFLTHLHFVYFGPRSFQYYGEIFGIYVIFGLCWLTGFLLELPKIRDRIINNPCKLFTGVFYLSFILLGFTSYNMYYLKYAKEDLWQYRFKEIIDASGKENPTVINYRRLDFGVNTVAGLVPDLRFFCTFNLSGFNEQEEELTSCIERACADYLIVHNKNNLVYPEFETYEHAGWLPALPDQGNDCYHYYVPKHSTQ